MPGWRITRRALLLALAVLLAAPPRPAAAQPIIAATCQDAPLSSGATARVCLPEGEWQDVLVYAPGFAPAPGFRNLELPGGESLPEVIAGRGLAFATSSVGLEADTGELVDALPALLGRAPRRVILAGASQGSLVVTRLAEQSPARFAGALALCGPLGEYQRQVDYFGDTRVLFDYFFPGVLPGSPVEIPPWLIAGWESTYAPAVAAALQNNPARAAELVAVAGVPIDASTPERAAETSVSGLLGVLWYNVFATNGARQQLDGNPYGNAVRVYAGSSDDATLNGPSGVARFTADEGVAERLAASGTSGRVRLPLVVMHTTGDEIVPFRAAERYLEQARAAGYEQNVTLRRIERYGHCNFTSDELLLSFFVLNQAIEARLRVFLPVTGG
jgi:pimeloyl-ACP methyl ester carboxylesterase